jgi:hypothetical protein
LQNVLYRIDACDLHYIPPTTNASEFASWICTAIRTGKLGICPEFTLLVLGFNGFAHHQVTMIKNLITMNER